MNDENIAIQHYYSLNPIQFGFLESLNLSREILSEGCSDYLLDIKMRTFPRKSDTHKLSLSFWGVRNLRLGNLEGLTNWFIEIRSIHEHQLEDLEYRVIESENEAFSFYCKDFKATIVDEKTKRVGCISEAPYTIFAREVDDG